MTELTLLPGPSAPDLLASLRALALSEGQARAAFDTWATAQAVGWDQLRRLREPSTWYRHLELLAQAGVDVPLRPYKGKRRPAGHKSHLATFWELYRHVGRSFTITNPWEPEGFPEGATGYVSALLFRGGVWCFQLDYHGLRHGSVDQLPIEQVLSCCTFSEGGPDAA